MWPFRTAWLADRNMVAEIFAYYCAYIGRVMQKGEYLA